MKIYKYVFDNDSERYRDCAEPQNLPGVKKKSFVLPFSGGEIWFEHLDGMYQYTDLVLEKLKEDSRIFLLPSKPSQIGFVLDETLVTKGLVDEIVKLLCDDKTLFSFLKYILQVNSMHQARFLKITLSKDHVQDEFCLYHLLKKQIFALEISFVSFPKIRSRNQKHHIKSFAIPLRKQSMESKNVPVLFLLPL